MTEISYNLVEKANAIAFRIIVLSIIAVHFGKSDYITDIISVLSSFCFFTLGMVGVLSLVNALSTKQPAKHDTATN